jgi:hypothetical protein
MQAYPTYTKVYPSSPQGSYQFASNEFNVEFVRRRKRDANTPEAAAGAASGVSRQPASTGSGF